MESLVIHTKDKDGNKKKFHLTPDKPLTVGRISSNEIVIHDSAASRTHCKFIFENDVYNVVDLGSKNGILVNGAKLTKSEIRPGDIIQIGHVVFEIKEKKAADLDTQTGPTSIVELSKDFKDAVAEETMEKAQEKTEENASDVSSLTGPTSIVELSKDLKEAAEGKADVIQIHLKDEFVYHPDPSIEIFLREHAHESAVRTFAWYQIVLYVTVMLLLLWLLAYDWLYFITIVNFIFASFYIVAILYKLVTVLFAAVKKSELVISDEELSKLDDSLLPVYTVLLPLYKEPEVTSKILASMDALDYPKDKLDVKILLEEDDGETLDICREEAPCWCEIIVVPDAQPRTKPRACNHGLERAKGEFLVIYDAEDRPEKDQLKKAVAAFRSHPEAACFQSKLNYFNQGQNFLTRWFTVEYTAWFDLFLPGLHSQHAPIPLGGTSNHFRTDIVQEVGGWDPFNVTEDADLGIRLYKKGYLTQILDSTTWEEANARVGNWIRQRSRWIKGYLQTHLVHMRKPFSLIRDLGLWGFLSFLFTIGGMAFMMLLNPIYWIAAAIYGGMVVWDMSEGKALWDILSSTGLEKVWMGVTVRDDFHAWQMVFVSRNDSRFWSAVSVIFFFATIILLISNVVFILINFLAAKRRSLKGMVLNNLLSPLYWALISVAAWKGFLQLFFKPFYWEKTVHGYFEEDA